MLAVAYVVRLEDLARDVQAMVTGAAVATALGADLRVPEWEECKASFDAQLAAEPPKVRASEDAAGSADDMRAIKMRALSLPVG